MERRYRIFWPLVLIAAGVLWILIEMGLIPPSNLWALAYVWPLVLIAAGVALLLRPYWRYAGMLISVLVVGCLFLSVVFADRLGWTQLPLQEFGNAFNFAVPVERGSGRVVTESRTVQDFNAIHVDYPAQVSIKQGRTEAVTIRAEDNVVAAISTEVVDHTLVIDSVRGHRTNIAPTHPVNISVTVKDLTELDFNAAGEVQVDALKAQRLDARLDGAGNMRLLRLTLDTLDAHLSGVGSMEATGTAQHLSVQVDGVGNFKGAGLKAQDVVVTLDGLGGADVWADHTLVATVNGVGSVTYSGSASVTKSVSGVGTVKFTGNK